MINDRPCKDMMATLRRGGANKSVVCGGHPRRSRRLCVPVRTGRQAHSRITEDVYTMRGRGGTQVDMLAEEGSLLPYPNSITVHLFWFFPPFPNSDNMLWSPERLAELARDADGPAVVWVEPAAVDDAIDTVWNPVVRSASYAALSAMAGRVARWLSQASVGPGASVGVVCDNGLALVACELGVIQSGNHFAPLPLPGTVPRAHLAGLLERGGFAALLADPAAVPGLVGIVAGIPPPPRPAARAMLIQSAAALLDLDCNDSSGGLHTTDTGTIAASCSITASAPAADGQGQLFCLFHTSGSTGVPKRVTSTRREFSAYARAIAATYGLDRSKRLFVGTNGIFDPSAGDIFAALGAGATVCLAPWQFTLENLRLCVELTGATHVGCTPSVWSLYELSHPADDRKKRRSGDDDDTRGGGDSGCDGGTLETVALGGELMPTSMARTWLGRGVALINLYGLTEGTGYQTAHTIPLSAATAPDALLDWHTSCIGCPLQGVEIMLLPDNGCSNTNTLAGVSLALPTSSASTGAETVDAAPPEAAEGELLLRGVEQIGVRDRSVGGSQVQRFGDGWLRTGDHVRRAAPPAALNKDGNDGDEDGGVPMLVFVGRRDTQVKLNGRRMELGDIERAVVTCPLVRGAIATVRDGRIECVAWRAPAPAQHGVGCSDRTVATAVRAHVRARTPGHMVPATITMLPGVPALTATGKICRRTASLLALDAATHVPATAVESSPLTSTEARVSEAWAWALGVPKTAISARSSLVELGGDSLTALRVARRLREVFLGKQDDHTFGGRVGDISGSFAAANQLDRPILRDYAAFLAEQLGVSAEEQRGSDTNHGVADTGDVALPPAIAAATAPVEAMLEAARMDDIAVLRVLLEAGGNPDGDVSRSNPGMSPLHVAAAAGSLGVAKLLLEGGASVTAVTPIRVAPAHLAAAQRHGEPVTEPPPQSDTLKLHTHHPGSFLLLVISTQHANRQSLFPPKCSCLSPTCRSNCRHRCPRASGAVRHPRWDADCQQAELTAHRFTGRQHCCR